MIFAGVTGFALHPVALRRRRFRRAAWLGAALLAIAAIAAHARVGLDDWQRFDGRTVHVMDVVAGDAFRTSIDGRYFTVHLLGIDSPSPADHGGADALKYTTARLSNRDVILRFDGTQTRDGDALRAYVYITPADCLNADAIHDGMGYADRRVHHAFAAAFETAEADARKRQRGLWRGLLDSEQPQWRQEWLKALLARRQGSF